MKLDNPIFEIRKLRKNLASSLYPELCAQENPGKSSVEIAREIHDVDIEFDSRKFIAAVETFFGLNIFIFETFNGTETRFEIPNHRYFSARRFNLGWPSICIFRFRASLREDQYQLIISVTDDKESIRIWPRDITKKLVDIYTQVNAVYFRTSKIYKNLFDIDFVNPTDARGQVLDNSGRCRGLIFEYSGMTISLLTLPCAPHNLGEKKITTISLKLALQFMNRNTNRFRSLGSISGISVINRNGDLKLIGIWYSVLNYAQGIYIPLIEEDVPIEYINLKRYPPLFLNSNNVDTVGSGQTKSLSPGDDPFPEDILALRMIFPILRWLNAIGEPKNNNLDPISNDLLTRFQYNPSARYKFNLDRSLPNFDNFEIAIAWLTSKTEGLIEDKYIILPSLKFVEYLRNMLLRSQPQWKRGISYIPNYYLYRTDFKTKVLFTYEEVLHVFK